MTCPNGDKAIEIDAKAAGATETRGKPMKHKKTVTEAVLAANRGNARSSTGPRTERGKSNTHHNALRHSILAKKVVLETDEERADFQKLLQSWKDEFGPEGLLEKLLVEEIVTLLWKLQITLGLETRELSLRQDVRDQVGGVFHSDLKLPISDWDLPIDKGWECERIIVRAVAGKDTSRFAHEMARKRHFSARFLEGANIIYRLCFMY
jgi:hypothetical protein